jgi:hypothetical protein
MVNPRIARAQSLVEFALVIPFFILLITVFFDLGRLVYYSSTLNNAVQEGARYAIVRTTSANDPDVISRVKTYAIGMNTDDISITVDISSLPDFVIVTANYSFTPVTPGLKMVLGAAAIPVKAQSTMVIAPRYR